MPNPIFEDNLQVIDKSAHDFHNFLAQFKSRPNRTYFTHKEFQENNSNQQVSSKDEPFQRPLSIYQEDLFENKSQFKHKLLSIEQSGQLSEGPGSFEIRKPHKLNSSPPAKLSQQDNIKNQHPGQLIILRSAQELPHWLFEHIRKKNAPKLKNICIEEDKQRHSQIVASNQQFDQHSNQKKIRNGMAQRYLNKSYVARKSMSEISPQNFKLEGSFVRNMQRKTNSQMEFYKKVSSIPEMVNYLKSSDISDKNIPQRNQQMNINDYEYSYCPDPEAEDRKRSFKSANNKSAVFQEISMKKMQSTRKSKNRQYRIRQEQKTHKKQHNSKAPNKRLPTVSQQQPLVEPKKFVIF